MNLLFEDILAACFRRLEGLPNLKKLSFGTNRFAFVGSKRVAFEFFLSKTALKEVTIDCVEDHGDWTVAGDIANVLSKSTSLQRTSFSRSLLYDHSLGETLVCATAENSSWKELDLSGCHLHILDDGEALTEALTEALGGFLQRHVGSSESST